MSPIDPRVLTIMEAARSAIEAAASSAVAAAIKLMPALADAAPSFQARGRISFAKMQLFTHREAMLAAFGAALREKMNEELNPKSNEPAARADTDWEAIGLVEEDHIEERLSVERIGSLISHECDTELRELNGYLATILRRPVTDPDLNPLRANVVGHAMHQAIESSVEDPLTRRLLEMEVGKVLATSLREAYAAAVADLKSRGIRRAELVARTVDHQTPGGGALPHEESLRAWERSILGRMPTDARAMPGQWETSMSSGRAGPAELYSNYATAGGGIPHNAAALLEGLMNGGLLASAPTGSGGPYGASYAAASAVTNIEMMGLLRRLTDTLDSTRGRFDEAGGGSGSGGFARSGGFGGAAGFNGAPGAGGPGGLSGYANLVGRADFGAGDATSDSLPPPNLIRVHRALLNQQSPGHVDQMVIDVVGSLFDQILSDPQVPPQMARQIARLQLPVLRVALRDAGLFANRRHPVRRFINRIASLGAAWDDFSAGAGQELLERVRALVNEIVEGDFDQIELYDAKLLELEQFSAEQAQAEAGSNAAVATLQSKELEWLALGRFSQRLSEALKPLAIAPYLKEFISLTWAEVIMRASQPEGEQSAQALRFRAGGTLLLTSVLPQRTLEERRSFLSSLPGLMAVLKEGMALIAWPEESRNAFFGKLMTDHAGSLKGAAASELDYNLHVKRIESALKTPVAIPGEAPAITVPESFAAQAAPALEQRFSADEAASVGLLDDEAVAPDASVDIVLDLPAAVAPSSDASGTSTESMAAEITPSGSMPFDPTAVSDSNAFDANDDHESVFEGPQLRDNLMVGFSYQLQLNGVWEKLRLTYMSPGRTLFLFAHGAKNRGTITMTSRMLDRLCSTHRLKAFETASLIDRSTARARAQLAALAVPMSGASSQLSPA